MPYRSDVRDGQAVGVVAAGADARSRRYAWRVLSVTTLGVLLASLNTSTLDVGLPTVARHFNASAAEASWFLLSFMLVTTVLILVFGRVADIVGRRRLYLVGLSVLTTASLLCGLAPNAISLIVLRALQAVGSAAIVTNTTALLVDAFPAGMMGLGLGLNTFTIAFAQVTGPLLGGFLATTFGWRAVFWFNVPVGVVGVAWATLSLHKDRRQERREPFDYFGALLGAAALTGCILALAEGGAVGWSANQVRVGLLLAVLGLPAFIWVERRRRYPMLDLSLFASWSRTVAFFAGFLVAVSRFAVVLLIALYLQAASGLDPFHAGLRVCVVAAGMGVAGPLTGLLSARYSARTLASAGLAVIAIGLLGLAAVIAPDASVVTTSLFLALIGMGNGAFMPPNTTSIMFDVPPDRRGIANGVRSMIQNAGYVVSTALSLAIVTSELRPDDKRAAYAGTLSSLSPDSLKVFTRDYRLALIVLAGVSILGMILSLTRNADQLLFVSRLRARARHSGTPRTGTRSLP